MKNFKIAATYISLSLAMMLLITVMMVQFLKVAFPKDLVMEAKIPIIEDRTEKRKEALEQLKREAMCEDSRFDHSDCE